MTRTRPADGTEAEEPPTGDPPLRLRGVGRTYERGGETLHALEDVDPAESQRRVAGRRLLG